MSHRPTLSSGLSCKDPRAEIEWLQAAFGFELVMLVETVDGAVAHSELQLGGSVIMVGGEWSENNRSPLSLDGRNTQSLHIQIDSDVDAHCERARAVGARIFAEPENQFYGDRVYRCVDPEGHIWTVGETVSEVSREVAEASTGLKITGWP